MLRLLYSMPSTSAPRAWLRCATCWLASIPIRRSPHTSASNTTSRRLRRVVADLRPPTAALRHRGAAAAPTARRATPSTVLDAACGSGRHSVDLATRGHAVIGVDQSLEMLTLAREKVPDGRFLPGDLSALPLDDASVDAALCALALVHVVDVRQAIGELARVVRPGGRIVITDVHPVLVMLGWQAQFPTVDGRGFMRRSRTSCPTTSLAPSTPV